MVIHIKISKIFFIIVLLLVLFSCKKEQENKITINTETNVIPKKDVNNKCNMPEEVRNYIISNKEYEFLTDKDLKLIKEYLDSSFCST